MTDELRRVAEAATPGPWIYWIDGDGVYINAGTRGVTFGHYREADKGEANAAFIATFDPPTVLKLLDVVEAAREAVDWLNTYDDGPGGAEAQKNLVAALAALEEKA